MLHTSSHRRVAAAGRLLCEQYLPQLDFFCTEATSHAKKIVSPHAEETLAVFFLQFRPRALEVRIPSEKRRVVIAAEIMPVPDVKEAFEGRPDLIFCRQYTAREDVFVEPWITSMAAD